MIRGFNEFNPKLFAFDRNCKKIHDVMHYTIRFLIGITGIPCESLEIL